MKVLFTDEIPASIVKVFVDNGYKVHIYGGGGLFRTTRPAFKLAKLSGVNSHFVHWGELKHIRENNSIDMFVTSDEQYKDVYGYNRFIPDTIDLAEGDPTTETVSIVEERWVTQPADTKGGESCPICITLQKMGWVENGQPVEYRWPGNSKILEFGLPLYRQAHSVVGDGNWKVGDKDCKCYKEFRNGTKTVNLSKSGIRVVNIPTCNHTHE